VLSVPDARAERDPGFVVVVHPDNPTSRASRRFLASLFLKDATRWDDGEAARPVDLKADSAARRRFSQAVLNRSVAAVKSYWQQRIFSGRGVPPPELDSEQAVLAYVLKHRGAVGYVSTETDLGKAKVLGIEW
jgi:ABC-type phosphate transport system substrate-binding protein